MSENNNDSYITQEEANERVRKFAMHTIEAVEENSLMAPVALKLLSALERSMQKMVEPPPPTYQQLQAMVAVLKSNLSIEQDKQSALEAKCAALAAELEAAEKRIAELEGREVELPEPFKMAKSSSGLTYYYEDEVNNAIRAAGISIKGE